MTSRSFPRTAGTFLKKKKIASSGTDSEDDTLGAGWDKGNTCFSRQQSWSRGSKESLSPQSLPLSPFQLQHAIPSPTAVSAALVHINSAEPLLQGITQWVLTTETAGSSLHRSCPPGGVIHISSCSFLLPCSHLAAFLSLHGQSSFPSQSNFPFLFPQSGRFFLRLPWLAVPIS